jgi:hypothetical protein
MNKVILCCGKKGCPVLRWKDVKQGDGMIMRFDDGTESEIKRGELELISEALGELDKMRREATQTLKLDIGEAYGRPITP